MRASMLLLALTVSPVASAGPPTEEYKLVWADEFDGTDLDVAKWDHRQLGPRRGAVNTRRSVSLDGNGHLLITTRKVGNEYHTGMIGTQGKFETRFGYFECRVRMQRQIGHWSAFWLQSPTMSEVGDTKKTGAEIDIFEYLCKQKDLAQINLHWDGYGKQHRSAGTTKRLPGLGDGFHTIAVQWTPADYTFYYDGREVWRTAKGISHSTEYIILSCEVGKWAGDIAHATLPDSVEFDYVRVYQRQAGRDLTQDERTDSRPSPSTHPTGAVKKDN